MRVGVDHATMRVAMVARLLKAGRLLDNGIPAYRMVSAAEGAAANYWSGILTARFRCRSTRSICRLSGIGDTPSN